MKISENPGPLPGGKFFFRFFFFFFFRWFTFFPPPPKLALGLIEKPPGKKTKKNFPKKGTPNRFPVFLPCFYRFTPPVTAATPKKEEKKEGDTTYAFNNVMHRRRD